MTDSLDTSEREAEEPRMQRLPVREMSAEPAPPPVPAGFEVHPVGTLEELARLHALEQWMREQKPVACIRRNEVGQISMQTPEGQPFDMSNFVGRSLFTAPVPASQGDGELRRLILSAEAHRKDRDWELMILDLREAAALAAPVTTKEAEG